MTTAFAISNCGIPELFNSDCQYRLNISRFDKIIIKDLNIFTGVLKINGIRINMGGKGRAVDKDVIERFWRTLKYD